MFFFFQLGLISYGWTHDFSQGIPGLTLTICNKILVRILQDVNWFNKLLLEFTFCKLSVIYCLVCLKALVNVVSLYCT